MLYTVRDGLQALGKAIAVAKADPAVLDRLNEAQERLIVKGDWKNTIRPMIIATQNNTLTCPREVEKILMVNINGTPSRIWSQAYQFLESGPGEIGTCQNAWCEDLQFMGHGYPTYFDPPTDEARKIVALSTSPDDIGKKVTIQGYTTLNNEVRTDASPGEELTISYWYNGVEGSIDDAAFPTKTTKVYRQVTSLHKGVTKGYIALYVVNESDDNTERRMWFLTKIHPNETCPGYSRYRVLNMQLPQTALDTTGDYLIKLQCLVKMAYVPGVSDNDILVIQNLHALKAMAKAIGFENSQDDDNAKKYETRALRLLEEQLIGSQSGQYVVNVDVGDHGVGDHANVI